MKHGWCTWIGIWGSPKPVLIARRNKSGRSDSSPGMRTDLKVKLVPFIPLLTWPLKLAAESWAGKQLKTLLTSRYQSMVYTQCLKRIWSLVSISIEIALFCMQIPTWSLSNGFGMLYTCSRLYVIFVVYCIRPGSVLYNLNSIKLVNAV